MNSKPWFRRTTISIPVFFASLLCLAPVWSDDTEIFFGDVGSGNVRPNVLFIIDTSGSMDGYVSGTGKDRLDNVKDAFYQLLGELNNVNVGLMRFTNPGGPVLYPVKYIDEDVNAGSIISTTAPVVADSDDAQEVVSDGSMILDRDELQLVTLTQGTLLSFYDRVNRGDDDAEERLDNGSNYHSGTQLDFLGADPPGGQNHNDQMVGVRFSGSSIPKGATITNAFIRFTGRNNGNSDPVYVRISGEARDSGDFSGVSSWGLQNRAKTSSQVDWNILQTVAADQTIDTPDLTDVVQEIVDHPDWNAPNSDEDDMVFFFQPQPGVSSSGERDFISRDESFWRGPELYVEYYDGPAPSNDLSRVGLRFQSVDVPRGVTITNAYVQFVAERDFSSTYDLSIAVEDSGSSTPFSPAASDISSRSLYGTQVNWAGSMTKSSGESFDSPDLSTMIEGVTARNDWCGGNALTVVISGSDGEIPVWAHEGSESLAPRLVVQYEYDSIDAGNSCIRRSISRSVNASSDDGEESGPNTSTTSDELNIEDGNLVGLRFRELDIPQGADILEAHLTLTSRRDDTGSASIDIHAEASDNAAIFASGNGMIEDRSYHATKSTWSVSNDWDDDDVYHSPDISSLIETVTDRAGWAPGNSLSLKLENTADRDRRVKSFNDSPGESPRLDVEFTDDGSGMVGRKTRDVLIDIVSDLNHNGWTPIQDTLYEAALYYTGDLAKWGKARGVYGVDGGPFSYARISSAESLVPGTFTIDTPEGCSSDNPNDSDCRWEHIDGAGARYQTPIDDSCQAESHIVLLTDGEANRPHSKDLIESFIGSSSCENRSSGEECVKELAEYLHTQDQSPLSDTQVITTHTIGFNFSSQWLEDVATAGGGTYATANNATELVEHIKDIFVDMLKTDSTFVAPVAAVNEFNQLSHLNQVYFAVFRPDEVPRWPGNLKKYSLGGPRGALIVDVKGDPAVDPDTGFFNEAAQSYWSADVDGAAVDKGGAASSRPAHDNRNLYTYYDGSASTVLSHTDNQIASGNSNLTKAMFDASSLSDTEFSDLVDWVRGKDVDDEDDNASTGTRYYFGDPLHSRPVAITYGGTEENPDVEVFLGTNAGVIQAVNAANGVETFAFMPEALLPMQADLKSNRSTVRHLYGMDGTLTPWTNDNGRNGIDTSDPEDFVRLYGGMRRGGRNYYALDVTDRANPELMWTIEGGQVQANGDDFTELGQTWSRPIKTSIFVGGESTPTDVLIFSGGYDDAQDDAQYRTEDSMGRAIYIVDAESGDLLWSGGYTGLSNMTESFADMKWSFPGTPSVVDVNQDDLADAFFLADTGGQLWRFDIRNGETLGDMISGGVIADLGVASGTNTIEDNRRFFGSPSIALVRGPGGPELTIAIGSGFRPSPLSVLANNRMYMIRQTDVSTPPENYTRITTSDLYDSSSNVLTTGEGDELAQAREALADAKGWYFNLTRAGEKVLSSPLIANDQIVFTTYVPGDGGIGCSPAAGTSYAYAAGLEDAVRDEPSPLRTTSIVDQATVIVPPPDADQPDDPNTVLDPNTPEDPNEPDPNSCPNGNNIVIKLNTEDGPIDNWCNDSSKTYWQKLK